MPYLHELANDEELVVDGAGEPGEYYHSNGLDYIAETDKTASGVFRCDHIGRDELRNALVDVACAAYTLDRYKKAMFRKRSREESGLASFKPEFGAPLIIADDLADLFHGIIGVCTEAGEGAEILIKYLDTGTVDMTNVSEEAGDLLWYISRLVKFLHTSFLTVMKQNIAKLRKRHGEAGFNREADIERNLAAEREVLEEEASMEMHAKLEEEHPEDYGED